MKTVVKRPELMYDLVIDSVVYKTSVMFLVEVIYVNVKPDHQMWTSAVSTLQTIVISRDFI